MLLFLFAVIVIYFSEKKEMEFLLAAVLFKTDILVELGTGLLFPEGKQCSELLMEAKFLYFRGFLGSFSFLA